MSVPDRLPDEAIDGLLDGSPSEEAAGTPLAAYLSAIRADAEASVPAPSQRLSTLLAEGLDPAELGAVGAVADGRDASPWWRRSRLAFRALVTKFAALGLMAKAATAGAAVTVAASGAGAAGVLPGPAQDVFDGAVGRPAAEAPAETGDGVDSGGDVDGEAGDAATSADTPADTESTPPLDADISDDATGDEDGDVGVDGTDTAEDASEGRSTVSDDTPRDESPAGPERGQEAVDDAPASPSASPATDAQERQDGATGTNDADSDTDTEDAEPDD